jgi:hypothetical protein
MSKPAWKTLYIFFGRAYRDNAVDILDKLHEIWPMNLRGPVLNLSSRSIQGQYSAVDK